MNPFAVVSLPIDSGVCDSVCSPILEMFRDYVFHTLPHIVISKLTALKESS